MAETSLFKNAARMLMIGSGFYSVHEAVPQPGCLFQGVWQIRYGEQDSDTDGWRYAFNFFTTAAKWKKDKKWKHLCRRRQWYRKQIRDPNKDDRFLASR